MFDELPRPPEALGSGRGGSVADEAGSGGSGKQVRAEERPPQTVEHKHLEKRGSHLEEQSPI